MSPVVPPPDPSAQNIILSLTPTGEIWISIGKVASRVLTDHEVNELVGSLREFQGYEPIRNGSYEEGI